MSAAIPTLAIFLITSAAPPDAATPTAAAPTSAAPTAAAPTSDAPTATTAPTNDAPTATAAPISDAPTAAAAPATSPAPRWRRREQLAGAVVLPLGLAALGALVPTLLGYRRTLLRADEVHASATCSDRAALTRLLTTTRREEAAIATLGVAAGVLLTAGVVLLVRGRRPPPRVQLGLDLRDHFGGLALSGRF